MLIRELNQNIILQDHICIECRERGFGIIFHQDVSPNDRLIIKVDSYYNSLPTKSPPSPDCLIIQRCSDGIYSIFIIELKDISTPGGFNIKNIRQKFETCIVDFMCGVLRNYFYNTAYSFRRIRLLFVTDPYKEKTKGSRERFNKSTKLDALLALNTKPLKFDNKYLDIEHMNQDPIINPC